MKISISYRPDEAAKAAALIQAVKILLQPARVHNAGEKSGFLHAYITTKQK